MVAMADVAVTVTKREPMVYEPPEVIRLPQDILHEFRPEVIFEVEPTESPACSAVTTECDGKTFQGFGPTVDSATQYAAIEVIKHLQETNQTQIPEDEFAALVSWKPGINTTPSRRFPAVPVDVPNMSPLMYLNQVMVKNAPKWELSHVSLMPSKFKATVVVNNTVYEGVDSTKKLAKQKAAEAALEGQFGIDWSSHRTPSCAKKRGLNDVDVEDSSDSTPMPTPSRRKRKQTEGGTPVFPKYKNPLQILNEFRRGIVFNLVSQEGPSHAPTITVAVEVDGVRFQRESSSKQKAKSLLASDIVTYFVENGQLALSDSPENSESDNARPMNAAMPNRPGVACGPLASPGKTPLMMLYELSRDQPSCEVKEFEENRTKRFVASYVINGQTFQGEGLSKQRAKHRAAEIILRDLYGVTAMPNGDSAAENGTRSYSSDVRYRQFADRVRRLVMDQWRRLGEELSEESAKRKVIAGIVLSKDATPSTANGAEEDANGAAAEPLFELEELLCVTTGTKCLGGEFLNGQGTALNDCHAEVLSTRCLRHLLLENMRQILVGHSSKLLEPSQQQGLFRVKPGLRFHLYISTAPCGDGRIFSPHDLGDLNSDTHPGRRSRGLLRTKIESGEGTIPVMTSGSGLQTFDGVIQGERLLTMSCSDKLCLWNAVGVQGALVSRLLEEPIYYDSIILGSVFVESHLERALFGRVAGLREKLPAPYALTKPKFIVTTERDERQPRKSPNISVVWMADVDGVEVVIAPKGRLETDAASRLCKQRLFRQFCGLQALLPEPQRASSDPSPDSTELPLPPLYAEAKRKAAAYCAAKEAIRQHLKSNGLGAWVRRPMEQDLFELVE